MTESRLRGLALFIGSIYLSKLTVNNFERFVAGMWLGVQIPYLTIEDTGVQKCLRSIRNKRKKWVGKRR